MRTDIGQAAVAKVAADSRVRTQARVLPAIKEVKWNTAVDRHSAVTEEEMHILCCRLVTMVLQFSEATSLHEDRESDRTHVNIV